MLSLTYHQYLLFYGALNAIEIYGIMDCLLNDRLLPA